jgi:F-type H+-transporting ATPase subunit gamma
MQTIEGLKRKIESTQDLHSIVKTMKALAAVNIRQYEKAVESLQDYDRTIELGFQVILRNQPEMLPGKPSLARNRVGAIVFGSDQGMCGPLNEQVVSHAVDTLNDLGLGDAAQTLLAVGERTMVILEDLNHPVEGPVALPSSVAGITPIVQELLLKIEAWNTEKGIDRIFLFYSKRRSAAAYRPHHIQLLPLDPDHLQRLKTRPWESPALPLFTMAPGPLFSALVHQYLFVSLFRAMAESLASENASRLAAMQGAEKNIQERLGELQDEFHRKRQMSITEELLDIVAGFEALREDAGSSHLGGESSG